MPKSKQAKNPFKEAFLNTGNILSQFGVYSTDDNEKQLTDCRYGFSSFPVLQGANVGELSDKYFTKNKIFVK